MAMTAKERIAKYRKRQKEAGLLDSSQRFKKKHAQVQRAKDKARKLGIPYVEPKIVEPVPTGFVRLPTGNLMDTRDPLPQPPAAK